MARAREGDPELGRPLNAANAELRPARASGAWRNRGICQRGKLARIRDAQEARMAAAGEKFSVPDEGSGRACALLRGAAGGFLSEMCIFAAVNERLLQSFGFFFLIPD